MRRPLLLGTLFLLACGSSPDGPEPPAPRVPPPAQPEPEPEPRQGDLGAHDLLPLRDGRVLWYRAELADPQGGAPRARQVALFSVWDQDAGLCLETVGLGSPPLRLVVRGEAGGGGARAQQLFVLPGGLDERGYSLRLEGWRRDLVPQRTPAGTFPSLRLDHNEPGLVARHWLAVGRGLVRLELEGAEGLLVRLELVEELKLGPPQGGYDCRSPKSFWGCFLQARRRLDVSNLERMLDPALKTRLLWSATPDDPLGTPPRDVLSRARADPTRREERVERIRRWMPDLLDVHLEPKGLWQVKEGQGGEATATCQGELLAWIDGAPRRSRMVLVLRRGAEGDWRLADFHPPPAAQRDD